MSIQGNLDTMKLTDLLRWIATQGETGVLELERNRVCKRIAFSAGTMTGCSSDDPPARIGQFLLARGKITREALARALELQSESGQNLGLILQEMGEIEAEELGRELADKAEENILSLFDWHQAVFKFQRGASSDPWMIAVNLGVEEIIEHGLARTEDLSRIRSVLPHSGVVLERGEIQPPETVTTNGLARGILGTIDGARTIADVLYHTHAAEFIVLKFLASAVRAGFAEIVAEREADPQHPTLLDHDAPAGEGDSRATEPIAEPVHEAPPEPEPQPIVETVTVPDSAPIDRPAADEPQASPMMVSGPPATFEERIELAQHFLVQEHFGAALDILDECYEERPGDEYLGHLIQKAEAAFIVECREGDLQAGRVPGQVPGTSVESCPTRFSAAERFLLGMMSEGHSFQTLLWIAPMREVDVYRAIARMKEAGLVEMHDVGEVDLEGTEVAAIEWA